MARKVLYIEDEPFLARIVKETLELKGYSVLHAKDGTSVMQMISDFQPDVCVLDVMLPNIDGFALGKTIRSVHARLPIIFLTAKSQTEDVLKGFSSGGTDYLKKPFSMEELMVRIENQVKMSKPEASIQPTADQEIKLGKLRFYPAKYELHTDRAVIKLSNRESQILNIFCNNINNTIERRSLLQAVWGDDSFFNSRNLDVYIRKLREYLSSEEKIEIITLKGQGYHFVVQQ